MSKPDKISFDIETLDTRSTAVVMSIGAVAFNDKELFQTMKVNISLDDQLRWGRTINGKTLLFWFDQLAAVRNAAITSPVPYIKALDTFAGFIKGVSPKVLLWANGQDFDLGIVGNLFDTVGVDRPWAYNAGRDMRTLVDLAGGKKPAIEFVGAAHDSLADAVHQAKIIQALIKEIKK